MIFLNDLHDNHDNHDNLSLNATSVQMPTTSVQLLHFGVKCSNFAIVKQNNKNNSIDRKIFFPGQEKEF